MNQPVMESVINSNENLIELQEHHDIFFASLNLILHMLSEFNYENAIKLLNAFQTNKITADKKSTIIKKVFTTLDTQLILLKTRAEELFNIVSQVSDKRVKLTIIPAIDIGNVWHLFSPEQQTEIWHYLTHMYINALYMSNPDLANQDAPTISLLQELVANITPKVQVLEKYFTIFPSSELITKVEFNPFIGVGQNNSDFGVTDIVKSTKVYGDPVYNRTSSMLQLLGIDKMLNMEELAKQLKNITKEQIEEATQSIKSMMGGVDENTSDMINSMLTDITDELQKDLDTDNPINNLVKIAETVAQKMIPKIKSNKVDINKVWNSTKKMASQYQNQNQDGSSMFSGANNPLSFLTGFMEKQMKNLNKSGGAQVEEEVEAEASAQPANGTAEPDMQACQNMLQQMGLGNMTPANFQNMDFNKLMGDLHKMNSQN